MSPWRGLFLHTYYLTLELGRQPMYLVSTVLFPSMFFWFFGVPNIKDQPSAILLMGSFASFAVLGVVLFQFGVGIAQDRESPWYSYLRVLPCPRGIYLMARVFTGILFSALAVLGVVATALIFANLDPSLVPWTRFFSVLFVGGVPFALLGICLGLSLTSRNCLPVANLVYLPLSFAGGLWMPPEILPKTVQNISTYLPTRMYAEWVWSTLFSRPLESWYPRGLVIYGLLFFALSIALSYRQEEKNFR